MIRKRYFIWAVIIFGCAGIYMPVIIRILQKESNILLLNEATLNIGTYTLSILASSVLLLLIKSADSSDEYIILLLDNLYYLLGGFIYIVLICFLLSFDNNLGYLAFTISILGTIISWIKWHQANTDNEFGTGALGS